MIVLIYVDWIPTVHWYVMPAQSRRVRGRGGEAALAVNVIVHGPAARSLTTAATGGALKERKLDTWWGLGLPSKRFEVRSRRRRPVRTVSSSAWSRSAFRRRHLAEEIPDEAHELAGERDLDLRGHHAATGEMPVAFVQAHLGFPRERAIDMGLIVLAQRERRRYLRRLRGVLHRLDQDPASVGVAGLRDPPSRRSSPVVFSLGTKPRNAIT